jgi:hypothetical protein
MRDPDWSRGHKVMLIRSLFESSMSKNSLSEKCSRGTAARSRRAALAACMSAAVLAGGCSGYDGVDLQGGVFDALGVSSSTQSRKLSDVRVEPRPGLVLPPSVDRLPEPVTGSIAAAPPPGEAWPVDPESRRQQASADLDRRHKEYCERALMDQRMRSETGVVMGPKGNCQPGLFGALGQSGAGQ